MTEFTPIEGLEGRYSVSREGEVYSHLRNKILKGGTSGNGYRYVSFMAASGVADARFIHRLVAKTFIPNPEGLPEVNHIDGNKINNHVDNLEWVTRGEACICPACGHTCTSIKCKVVCSNPKCRCLVYTCCEP